MALYQLLCGSAVMIILLFGGCHSQQPVCGQAPKNTRIVGGENASSGTWPWLVSLNSDDGAFCGGSLITKQWVLTAAHCITGNDLLTTTVYLGRLSQSGPNVNEEARRLERIVCHPSYDFLSNDNDICLLKLLAPVNFTDYIQPVCLASAGSTFHSGVISWVTGFGLTQADSFSRADILQEVDVPIVGNNECKCAYPEITANMICAGLKEGGKDSCQGDSGGPLVTKQGFVWIQSGVVSFGEGCAKPMTPGVYARVSEYQGWINNITDGSKPGFVTYTSSGVDSDLNITCSTPTTNPTTTMFPNTNSTPTTTTFPNTNSTPTTTMFPNTNSTPTTTMFPNTNSTPTTTTFPNTNSTPTTTMFPNTNSTPTTTMFPNTNSIPTPTGTFPYTTTKTTPPTTIPTICPTDKHVTEDGSVFGSGESVSFVSHFTSICLLVISLYVLVGV